ncbi:hypothetical protein BJY00DRAFT_314672 [Aspergillus carlsbadensis]|nr:hypothetical protein BJY00DRAFT_314672 [Aspergillus carlsbadensis]
MDCHLLKLPPSVIPRIIEHLDTGPSRRDLFNLALTCRDLNGYTMLIAYRHVTLRLGQARFLDDLLNRRPQIANHIQTLTIHYHTPNEPSTRPVPPIKLPMYAEACSLMIRRMRVLRSLTIKGYEWEGEYRLHKVGLDRLTEFWFATRLFRGIFTEAFLGKGLQNLESCKLDFSDKMSWSLHDRSAVFIHPTLKHLTIRHATMADFPYFDPRYARTSALEHLELLFCDISPLTLAKVLTVPKALQAFTMKGHRLQWAHTSDNWQLYIDALTQQQHSLEKLDLDFFLPDRGQHKVFSLRYLPLLKEVRMRRQVFFYRWSARPTAAQILPRDIRRVTLYDDEVEIIRQFENFYSSHLSNWRNQNWLPKLESVRFESILTLSKPRGPWWPDKLGGQVAFSRGHLVMREEFIPGCRFYNALHHTLHDVLHQPLHDLLDQPLDHPRLEWRHLA